MADPMNGGGMPPRQGGGMPPGGDPVKAQMSLFNPTDNLLMQKSGEVGPNQTIREFMGRIGLDVDKNTVMDLQKKIGEQVQNANPMNKMKNFAAMGKPGIPPGAPGPGAQPPVMPPDQGQGGTLEDLMK